MNNKNYISVLITEKKTISFRDFDSDSSRVKPDDGIRKTISFFIKKYPKIIKGWQNFDQVFHVPFCDMM